MLVIFWILLFMYVGLLLFYATTKRKKPEIPSWPVVQNVFQKYSKKLTCKTSADCPSTHVCISDQCIPKLLRTEDCNPATGQWISYQYQGTTFAVCICRNPELINQKHFGGNCDVNVGCGVHGKYISSRCECDPGYKAVGLTCQKMPAVEFIKVCDVNDEIQVSNIQPSDGFHPDYMKHLSDFKCVKRPCSFDAFSGRPLKHARFEPDWGCVCDPRYGLFGVILEGQNKNYLNTPGFDACASIYKEDPVIPINVKLITYFYLGKREPISFILFDNLNETDLISLFKGSTEWIIRQQRWKYDYAQHFFNITPNFRARTRKVTHYWWIGVESTNEWYYINDFSLHGCHETPHLWRNSVNQRVDAYNVLYEYPVCRVLKYDAKSDPMFWNTVVVNPQQITFEEFDVLHRFNAFVLQYSDKRWTLDLDYEYKVAEYRSIETNAPKYEVFVPKLNDDSSRGAIV